MTESLKQRFEHKARTLENLINRRLSSRNPQIRREGLLLKSHILVSTDRVLEQGTLDLTKLRGEMQAAEGVEFGAAILALRNSEQQQNP